MILAPIGERILVRVDPPLRKVGEITLPDGSVRFSDRGTVMVLGAGRDTGECIVPFAVAVGDRIMFDRYAGTELTGADDGGRYKTMREQDIIAIEKGEQ